MKHFYRFFLFIFFLAAGTAVHAAPGDTTIVQAHRRAILSYVNNYDSAVVFPNGTATYRKIDMTFTIGKYQCPGNPQYCGSWDYGVHIDVITPTDTFEIGRLITPYATTSTRFPWNWQHRYTFDVTDYASILKNNAVVRIRYSGYSGGFTANVKFTFIEGTPPRNVVAIKRLWRGSFAYGNTSNPIENMVNNRTLQMPANAQSAALKLYLTGHGGNEQDGCAEFCQKYYTVKLNNNQISMQDIWRDNCGSNNLYPQTGTWIFDRSNWCPGDLVHPYMHPLTGLTPGVPFDVDVDFQPYSYAGTTAKPNQAQWTLEGQVIYYGAYNQTTDASLESIISPSNHEAYFRENQACQEAKIEVRNTGSTALTSLDIEYGLQGGTMHTYQWTGNLAANQFTKVILPTIPEIQNVTTNTAKFVARITKANGVTDSYALNNEQRSTFTPLPVWSNDVVIRLVTNGSSNAGVNETSWTLFDAAGNVVNQRINNANKSTFSDTVSLQQGCYRLQVDDAGCDGVDFWYYQYYSPNPGKGSIQVRKKGSTALLPMRGYFNGDFGCGFSQMFYVANPLGLKAAAVPFEVSVFPNPATDMLQVNVAGSTKHIAQLKLVNSLGQLVYETTSSSPEVQIPVNNLAAGFYILSYQSGEHVVKKQVIVAH